MAQMVMLKVLLTLLFATLASCTFTGVRLELTHVDSDKGGLTKSELLQRAAGRDRLRRRSLVEKLSSTDFTAPVTFAGVSYYISLTIGTPPLPTTLFVDTGSDLIWTQCASCTECVPQSTPLYDPSKSSTFEKLSCNGTLCQALPRFSCSPDCEYSYTYGDGGSTQGFLATETFGFRSTGPVSLPSIGFGCGVVNRGPVDNASGIIGLSRGPLSLVTQLGLEKFSYCFTSYGNFTPTPLLLGSSARLTGSGIQNVTFVKNPSTIPFSTFYYLPLEGITVGGNLLSIPRTAFQLQPDGTGGLIIDSGSTLTSLIDVAYQAVKRAFVAQLKFPAVLDGPLDLCFLVPPSVRTISVPKLIFHFDGADLPLPLENYISFDQERGLLCLVMGSAKGISIFGNFQQQNMHVLYDLADGVLSFQPTQCDML